MCRGECSYLFQPKTGSIPVVIDAVHKTARNTQPCRLVTLEPGGETIARYLKKEFVSKTQLVPACNTSERCKRTYTLVAKSEGCDSQRRSIPQGHHEVPVSF